MARYPPANASRYATRATSNQTTNDAWWAIPCASVSAKRTRTSVVNRKPCTRASLYDRRVSAARLAELIVERQPCVVLTGAGVSTESGIPDFRSPTGIWAEVDPFEVASIQAFRRDPERVWDFYRQRIG